MNSLEQHFHNFHKYPHPALPSNIIQLTNIHIHNQPYTNTKYKPENSKWQLQPSYQQSTTLSGKMPRLQSPSQEVLLMIAEAV
jgi:hypothetical protein